MEDERIRIGDEPLYPDGDETPFGERWQGEHFKLTPEHLQALQAGKTLWLDVRGEYVVNLSFAGD